MVVVEGRSKVAAAMCFFVSAMGVGIVAYVTIRVANKIGTGTPMGVPWSQDVPLAIRLAVLPTLLSPFAAMGYFFGRLGISFVAGGVNAIITDKVVFFSIMPGSSFGREIRWADIEAFRTTADFDPAQIPMVRLNSWLMGNALSVFICLAVPRKAVAPRGLALRLAYLACDSTADRTLGDRVIYEWLPNNKVTGGAVLPLLREFLTNPELREKYGSHGAVYTASQDARGLLVFELAPPSVRVPQGWEQVR
jgi:hypothetical protein